VLAIIEVAFIPYDAIVPNIGNEAPKVDVKLPNILLVDDLVKIGPFFDNVVLITSIYYNRYIS